MKITKKKLENIIKEELAKILHEAPTTGPDAVGTPTVASKVGKTISRVINTAMDNATADECEDPFMKQEFQKNPAEAFHKLAVMVCKLENALAKVESAR